MVPPHYPGLYRERLQPIPHTRLPGEAPFGPQDVAALYDRLAPTFDEEFSSPYHQAENAFLGALIQRARCDRTPILDLACGTGLGLELLQARGRIISGREYVGVDISPRMIERADAKHPVHTWIIGDMAELKHVGWAQHFGSAISIFAGMNYAPHPDRVCRALYGRLAPDARFLVMLFGEAQARRADYGPCDPGRAGDDELIRRYSPDELYKLFGWWFDEVRVTGFQTRLGLWLGKRLPSWASRLWLELEHVTIGRIAPARCYYLIVTGKRSPKDRRHAG